MGVIYVRPNLINGKKYVGQATDLKKRQNDWKCLTQKYAGTLINRARKKYGIDNFGFEILKECDDKELDYWEKYYIKELNTKAPYGYNLTDGGGGMSGYTYSHSEETKKRISESLKGHFVSKESKKKMSKAQNVCGEKNPFYGKRHSEKSKQKMSEAHKGKTTWMKGKHHTEESKKKISNSHLKKEILQIDKKTNEVIKEFPSVREVQRQLGFNHTNISKCCLNKPHFKTAYGYIWKYKEESVA